MKTCNICGKRIKDVKVLFDGIVINLDVCGECLRPYATPIAPGEKIKYGKIVYTAEKKKKKK